MGFSICLTQSNLSLTLSYIDLTPFWLTQTSYWNSTEVRDWAASLHYSYPEFDGLKGKSPQEIREAILARVKELYGPTAHPGGPIQPAPTIGSASIQPGGPEKPTASQSNPGKDVTVEFNSITHEWTVHIRFKKFELGRSYSIQVFLGETYVGSVSAFTSASSQRCENCRNNQDVELEGFVHLNEAIWEKVHSLSPDVVEPLLAKDLRIQLQGWKVGLVAPFEIVCTDSDNILPAGRYSC